MSLASTLVLQALPQEQDGSVQRPRRTGWLRYERAVDRSYRTDLHLMKTTPNSQITVRCAFQLPACMEFSDVIIGGPKVPSPLPSNTLTLDPLGLAGSAITRSNLP